MSAAHIHVAARDGCRRHWASLSTSASDLGRRAALAAWLLVMPGIGAADGANSHDPRWSFVVSLRSPASTAASAARQLNLGATLRWRGLAEGIPAFERASASPHGAAGATDVALDPERIGLIETADSAAASRLAGVLSTEPAVEWFEPNRRREVALAPAATRMAGAPVARQMSDVERAPAPGTGQMSGDGLDAAWDLPPDFPNDPLYRDTRQWGLANRGAAGVYGGVEGADIHARRAWSLSCGAAGLRLAIADTGVDPSQPDLQQALPGGPRIELGLNTSDDPTGSWADSLGHGTAVCGVMAARTGDGPHFDSLGVAGVCGGDGGANPGCRIVALKITPGHSPYAWSFDVARAIVYATAVGARAVNLSFAASSPSRVEREALRYAIERGCLVVAAAGNNALRDPRAPQYPAAFAADGLCLQVGASDPWDRRAPWSSFGPGLDLVAPGVNVWTTSLTYPNGFGGSYTGCMVLSGTSLAAPFATGAAGLLAAARPELCADDLRQILRATARDIGSAGPDEETGMGALDAAAALEAVGPAFGVWHDEVAADTWTETGADSLVVGENGPGAMDGPRTWPLARRFEARATVTLPDSFADSVRVWPRVAGTSTVRGDFRLPFYAPHAQAERTGKRQFTLRGWFYRVRDDAGGDTDLPLPADQMRFGFTVIGRLARPAVAAAGPGEHASPDPALRIVPNPFRSSLSIGRPAASALAIVDLAGRCVRRWPPDGSVQAVVWDGRRADGAPAPPGLYWIRSTGPRGVALARAIKLE